MTRSHSLCLCLALGCAASPRAPARPRTVTLTLVGTSDLHGRVEMLPWLGGHLRVLRAMRDGAVLLVDAGDMFQGTIASNTDEGATVVAAYNALGYDAAAVGNHEFDYGPEGEATFASREGENPRGALLARAREARFPFLAANFDEGAGPWRAENIQASAVRERGGVRVGIIGVSTIHTPETTLAANVRGLAMRPLAETIAREARALREGGAAVVVVAAHAGGGCTRFNDPAELSSCDDREEVMDLARALPQGAVDVIVGGHTHRGMAHVVNGVPVIQSFANGVALGRADITVDLAARRVRAVRVLPPRSLCEGQRGEPDAARCAPAPYEGVAVTPDESVARVIAPAVARADALRAREIGVTLATSLDTRYDRESPLPNLLADAMRRAAGADVALMNHGGVRVDLPAGPLRYGSLYNTLPFDNRLVTIRLRGRALAEVIARSAGSDGGALAVSGLRATVRCDGARRVATVTRDDGRAVGDDEVLTVATNDYLASGSLRARAEAPLSAEETLRAPLLREALQDPLRALGPTLRGDDPRWFDPARLRVTLPSARPVRCGGGD